MQEFWINDRQDWDDFVIYLKEQNITEFERYPDEDGNVLVKVGEYFVHVPKDFSLEEKQTKIYDPLIFGKDSTENITNITVDNDNVYIYKSDGSVEVKEYYNWAVGVNWTEGAERLKGHQYYKYIKELPEDQWYNLKNNWNPRIWTPRTASEGFMLRSGMTYYKGMKVSDVSLLSFDIEATTLDKDDPEAKVVLVSMTYRDAKGSVTKKLFDIFEYNNKIEAMMYDIERHINIYNPDIILGHNILSYDLPYLNKQESLNWGKDGSKIIFDTKESKKRKDGQQQYKYFNANIHGREIIDTFFLSLTYDIGREFPSYGLKAIEKHLGLVKEDRIWDFQKWSVKKLIEAKKTGNNEIWEQFKKYCAEDSDSPIKMFDIMIPAFFYLAQSVPKTLQQMVNEASGSQLDSLMIRSYLQDGNSLPKSSQKEEFEGAISMGVPGVYKNVRKVDVASLYPSIMLQYEIYDKKKDPNRHMLKMLQYFRDERLNNKRLAKETGDRYYDDLQNSQKIMINSMYGFMGAGYLLFNYPVGAAEVTRHGREILLKGVEWSTGYTLQKVIKSISNEGTEDEEEKFHWILGDKVSEGLGYQLVNVDTDSFSYTNGKAPSKEDFKKEIIDLNKLYPELIKWEDDGVYSNVIVVKAKNYVLIKDGKIKFKGSSLTDQKKEPALIELLEKSIRLILEDKSNELNSLYFSYCREALSPSVIKRWCTKKTITKAVLESERLNETKVLDACDIAIKNGVISGIQEGDKIWTYQALDGEIQKVEKGEPVFLKNGTPKMIENCILKFPELYKNDHDKWHYVSRVYSTLSILKNIINIEEFEKYHLKSKRKLLEQ